MRPMGKRAALSLLLVAGAMSLGACVDEDVVFSERPGFQDTAAEAGGFVGYADPSNDDKLTICGACHTDMQTQWEATGHADAWAGLQESDQTRAFCESCHTVNSFGNVVSETDGIATGGHAALATDDGRYLDVQCESCHGPGLEHVLGPTGGNVPLAPVTTGPDLTFGCGECHQGFHHPFVEEWELSAHGSVTRFPASNEEDGCYLCHSGEGALQLLGVNADYLEKDALLGSTEFAQITCAVCHDPHGSENEGQLRLPVATTNTEVHLCAVCHDLQPKPDPRPPLEWLTTHSPHAGLMRGDAGWFPTGSGMQPGDFDHPHTNAERLCATCHVSTFSVTDEASGATFVAQGHRFLGAPCVDDAGRPLAAQDCALTAEARAFTGCVSCHTEAEAAQLLRSAVSELLPKVRTLAARLFEIDPNGAGRGGEIDPEDSRFTVAEGALFNLSVALSAGGLPPNDERARVALAPAVTHNPTLIETLIDETLAALEAEYGPAVMAAEPPESWWAPWSGS